MKKIVAVMISAALTLSLTACGDNESSEATEAAQTTTSATATESTGGIMIADTPEDDDLGWGELEFVE